MIVIGHIMGHGVHIRDFFPITYWLLSPFWCCGVNLFFWISGYFQIRLSIQSLFKFVFTVFFFSTVNIALLYLVKYDVDYGILILQDIFFPVSRSPYWFMAAYLR